MNKNLILTAAISIAIGFTLGFFARKFPGTSTGEQQPNQQGTKMGAGMTDFSGLALDALELPSAMARTASGELVPVFLESIDSQALNVGAKENLAARAAGPGPRCCPANPLCCRKVVEEGSDEKISYEDLDEIVFSFDYSRVGEGVLEVIMLSDKGEILTTSKYEGNHYDDTAAKIFYATAGRPDKQFTGNVTLLLRYTSKNAILLSRTIDLDVK